MTPETTQREKTNDLSPLQQSYLVIRKLKADLGALERQRTEPIAIIGAACRFPGGAVDMESYWRILRDGVDCVREVPRDRWDVGAYYHADPATPGKTSTRCAAFLDQVDQFDPLFFGISPREAVSLDPQQRLLLEVSWEALERAGHPPDSLAADRTGTFIGIGQMDYAQLLLGAAHDQVDVYAGTGNGFCFASGRLSYVLGLRGPNMAVDTACSSSLAAVHLACMSLRSGECDVALAGGVQLMLSPHAFVGLTKLGALSPDGKCKTFDASANGYGRGEGCGIVVLKPLSAALADGDHIAAVIRGSAVNHDGSSSGFTVPNGLAQQELLRCALRNAGVEPAQVSYVETHGTGTQLGDPIDVDALAEIFGKRPADALLHIGSVKTNIGHLEAAAGIAGLLKVVLALQHREIPPHLHFKNPSPHIRWDRIPVKVPTARTYWQPQTPTRIAGVSSFGLSGTNAHVVLEEAPAQAAAERPVDRTRHILPISARTPVALRELANRYQNFLAANPEIPLADFCFTCAAGRAHLPARAAIVGTSVAEMMQQLQALQISGQSSDTSGPPKVAFLFTGQGSQYPGMGLTLYRTHPQFRATLDRCAELLGPHLDRPLLEVLYPAGPELGLLHQTAYTQPAIFALEYSLAKLWMSWKVEPGILAGHSVGEYVAACLAGVFSLEDGLKLIAARARLMQSLPAGGAMAVVLADERVVSAALAAEAGRVSIAALNGPANTVISGDGEAVARLIAGFEREGIRCVALQVSHAFHSALMEPMLAPFAEVAREVRFHLPSKALISNLDGRRAEPSIATAEYWVEHVRRPVQFGAGMAALAREGFNVFLEVGPKPALLPMARQTITDSGALWLSSFGEGQDDWQAMLRSLAKLYERGARIDWNAFDRDYKRRRVVAPTYPFQRQRYWVNVNGHRPAAQRVEEPPAPNSFAGARLRLPLSREVRFETRFGTGSPGWLKDHKLFDTVVVPGAAHISLVLSAVFEAFATDACALEDLIFPQALVLQEESSRIVQTILAREADGMTFKVVSLDAAKDEQDPDEWTEHISGRLRVGPTDGDRGLPGDLDAIRGNCPNEVKGADFYAAFRHAGYGLGASFQWLDSIWQGDGEAISRLRVPDLPDAITDYRLYPGLVDTCFQSLGAGWRGMSGLATGDEVLIPFSIGRFQCFRSHYEGELWCHMRFRNSGAIAEGTLIADIRLLDGRGALVAEISGFEARKASRKALLRSLQGNLNDALYELVWRPAPAVEASPVRHSGWLVFCNDDPAAEQLLDLFRARGEEPIAVEAADAFARMDPRRFRLDPQNPEHYARLLEDAASCSGIVHFGCKVAGCASILHLLRASSSARRAQPPRLWMVTRNAVPAGPDPRPLSLEQSPVWGLGRVVAMEHPELRPVRIDLDPDSNGVQELLAELAAPGHEDQVAYRRGQRYVARLARFSTRSRPLQEQPVSRAYKLAMPDFGILDELRLSPLERRKPRAGEVEIAVRANGLNLRDVLLALGMFNDALRRVGITSASQVPFGFECAGEITAIGEGVERFRPGDAVMGLTLGGMNSHVIADARLICLKPAELSFEQAATIPLAFASAFLGLKHFARLQPGERVLIHAAAGGVGQAAIQVARSLGAEIFATASLSKWDFLREQGLQNVMNSRTLEFAEEIKRMTGGRGVHCVLNSLTGEFIPSSLDVLGEGGRFVELGRIGIWTEEQVHRQRPDVDYFNFDMAEICREEPQLISSMFAELAARFQDDTLAPLTSTVFPIQQAGEAFRFMAQAKHMGKIVLSHPRQEEDAASERSMIRGDGVYVITGGTGALGVELAEWMVSKGGRTIVLAGRNAPSDEAAQAIGRMRQFGAAVATIQADVADRAATERLLAEAGALGTVRGIVHAAGVLEDGLLVNQSWAQFRKVMAPKVDGAWNLHELSRDLPLDFFICYSSMASLLGSPGQGNYAAGNAFLDALTHHRRALGLPALTINWGAWAGGGMASRLDNRNSARWREQGIGLISPEVGLDTLERLWECGAVQAGVQPLNWPKFLKQFGGAPPPPLLELFAQEASIAADAGLGPSKFLETLESTPPGERLDLLRDEIRSQIASVLGLASFEDIELRARLFDLGLDSLMAVELKTRLERALGCVMRPTLVFDYPTVEALAGYFAQQPLARFFTEEKEPEDEAAAGEDEQAIADQLARELSSLEQAGSR
jgi:myxalamid-type polyketide synthase MxaB